MKSKETSNQLEITIRFFFLSLVILGFLYPLAVTGIAQSIFPSQAGGSLVRMNDKIVGSELFSQALNSPFLFRYRPSAVSFGTIPSGASNLSPSSLDLRTTVEEREKDLENLGISKEECSELLYASASGLDPHISTRCAYEQSKWISRQTKMPIETINELVHKYTEYPLFGFIGRERVNVTKLNLEWKQMIHE
ncbi:K+-transporting ATPase ATPase C chain [Leptospira meyeri]|uniref:Potassium-transporting ATPase KdpC subunit n=1 Tax=Leptospira meyeri TaxID=29508 RepID=A0A4R8MX27_LEPME|nr:potassium-transporting ATPase subunit C [Leptospira meyeri]EKJ85251.1 putative K+-transporting ATPase, C subunit [Leptospira meyeri serovar Hardjo str. Went 5]TDY71982.1 K+-transporting ATPase ATPase C chain [Leptospira meyeri]TGL47731.1 potassium-transporting ATPase subunit C [Leptospira meyeri]